ncbi:PadR family transcriptional regulator [Salinibacterium sp. ZJ450]|uniref:PadR family transcriptional regulator n=1 Tax=Salinibacterium sp. ZJ450 TaxID=2708338 RepID=UPI00141DF099|nr:PadR family transcriptional regulator [Salinibacterium sp. ZJ450]
MSTRMAILAVLTLGPAYGYQLHGEVVERTGRERPLNAGQVYSTLDRLKRDSLVRDAGLSDDRLPLYELSPTGAAAASEWLTDASTADWGDMVERVLLARSLPGFDASDLIASARLAWLHRASAATGPRVQATRLLAEAALRWLDDLPPTRGWPVRTDRPKRGRRRIPQAA